MTADDLQMVVTQQGAVRVNAASVLAAHADVVLVDVDLDSKYAEVMASGSGVDNCPAVYLIANERTLYLDASQPRDSMTVLEFRGLPGWDMHACGQPGRYTLRVAFFKG